MVKRIYSLCLAGNGPTRIARMLTEQDPRARTAMMRSGAPAYGQGLKGCKCRGVAVDGGRDYLKRLTGGPSAEFIELSVFDWPRAIDETLL